MHTTQERTLPRPRPLPTQPAVENSHICDVDYVTRRGKRVSGPAGSLLFFGPSVALREGVLANKAIVMEPALQTLPAHPGSAPRKTAKREAGAHPGVPAWGRARGNRPWCHSSRGSGHTCCTGPGPPCSPRCPPCLAQSLAHSWCLMSVCSLSPQGLAWSLAHSWCLMSAYGKDTEKGSQELKERREGERGRRGIRDRPASVG